MHSLKPLSIIAGLVACNALAIGTLCAVPSLALAKPPVGQPVGQQVAGGPLMSSERAAYCARTHDSDFYSGWVANHCTRAPVGVRFEYLRPAWECLCLGRD